jgi:hypothetical protein
VAPQEELFRKSFLVVHLPPTHDRKNRDRAALNQEVRKRDRLGLMRRMSRIGNAGRRGINRKHAAQQPLAIQTLDSRFQIRCIREFHKAEPSGITARAVSNNLGERDSMALLLEPVLQFQFIACVRYISDKQPQHIPQSPLIEKHFRHPSWRRSKKVRF